MKKCNFCLQDIKVVYWWVLSISHPCILHLTSNVVWQHNIPSNREIIIIYYRTEHLCDAFKLYKAHIFVLYIIIDSVVPTAAVVQSIGFTNPVDDKI